MKNNIDFVYEDLTQWLSTNGVDIKYRKAIFRTYLSDPEYYGKLTWQEVMNRTLIPAFQKGDD